MWEENCQAMDSPKGIPEGAGQCSCLLFSICEDDGPWRGRILIVPAATLPLWAEVKELCLENMSEAEHRHKFGLNLV